MSQTVVALLHCFVQTISSVQEFQGACNNFVGQRIDERLYKLGTGFELSGFDAHIPHWSLSPNK